MNDHPLPTRQKALTLNLDAKNYGTFAEIGGGQEVSRWFFPWVARPEQCRKPFLLMTRR
jgi:hypothetical protein